MSAITFERCGPELTEVEIAAMERHLQCSLPTEYRAFLLQHNGGTPSRRHFHFILADGERFEACVESFFVVDEHLAQASIAARGETVSCAHFNNGEFVPKDCLIIGAADHNWLLLWLRGEHRGHIDIKADCAMDEPGADRDTGVYHVAESFSALLDLLR